MFDDDEEDDDKPKEDYEVGYGKPLKNHQFKKGESGNRKGRPRKEDNRVDAAEVLQLPVQVIQGDTVKEMSPAEAGVRQLVNKALNGEGCTRSIVQLAKTFDECGVFKPPVQSQSGGVLIAPKGMTPHEWLEKEGEVIE